ncbi:hypothetical protein, partial [Klebsiella pneumoniae]
ASNGAPPEHIEDENDKKSGEQPKKRTSPNRKSAKHRKSDASRAKEGGRPNANVAAEQQE